MRSTPDLPTDPLGSLGAPIKPTAAPAPDPVKTFEHINDSNKAIETIAETLRKKAGVTVEEGEVADWEGLCMDPYFYRLLSCI